MPTNSFNKALVIVFVLCFFYKPVCSQTYSTKESSILSGTIGLTSSNLINSTSNYKSGILYSAGFSYSVMLNKRLNVAAELLYTGKAVKNDSPIIKFRYYYFDVPLYAQINLGENIRINAGAQYSIAMSAQRVDLDPSKKSGVIVSKSGNIKSSDYGFLLGLDVDLTKILSIGARYTLSGDAFFNKTQPSFGVFQLSFKYSPIRTYKEFFHKKESAK